MKSIPEIVKIANNSHINLEEKKRQIRSLLKLDPQANGLDKRKRILQKISPDEFGTLEQYNTYIKKYGNLLINDPDVWSRTLLMRLAATNAYDLIPWLVKNQGALPNLGSRNGVTPTHVACENGRVKMLRALIIQGADINQAITVPAGDSSVGDIFPGQTPIHLAIRFGHVDCVQILLRQKAYKDLKLTSFDLSSLEWAKLIRQHVVAINNHSELTTPLSSNYKITTSSLFGHLPYRDQEKIPTVATMDTIIDILQGYSITNSQTASLSTRHGMFSKPNLCKVALTAAASIGTVALYQHFC